MSEPESLSKSTETGADRFFRQVLSIFKTAFLALAFLYAVIHWSDLSDWLSSITHGEAFGIKFDRNAAEQKVNALQSKSISQKDQQFAQGAVARAARVGAAVAGARILWLDTNLPNNVAVRQVLETMNIGVQRAQSLTDAQNLAKQAVTDKEPYDLIISNISSLDGPGPLVKCPVAYSQFPAGATSTGSLAAFNQQQNASPKMGFAFAEWLASDSNTADAYMRPEQPRLISYSGSNGGIVSTVCARIVTNYADILLQNVVSALEESRWTKLPPLPTSKAETVATGGSK